MKTHFSIILFLIFNSVFLSACENETDLEAIKDTIHVNHEGALMPVYIYGNAIPKKMLIVVHGGPGGNGLEYRFGEYSDILENEMLVAYWDQRGQGMSQGKYDEGAITVQQMANDLEAVVLSVKKKYGEDFQVFLLGHSWGGMLGTKFMVEPNKARHVAGWIEANGAHDIPFLNKEAIKMFKLVSEEQILQGNSIDEWQRIKDWAESIDENDISVEQGGEINSKGFEVEGFLSNDGLIDQGNPGQGDLKLTLFSPINWAKSAITGSYTANVLDTEVESTSLTSQLNKITSPCLFIYSKYDFVVPPALGEDAYNKVSSTNKKLVILERSGHSSMASEPQLFTKAILDFVQNVPN